MKWQQKLLMIQATYLPAYLPCRCPLSTLSHTTDCYCKHSTRTKNATDCFLHTQKVYVQFQVYLCTMQTMCSCVHSIFFVRLRNQYVIFSLLVSRVRDQCVLRCALWLVQSCTDQSAASNVHCLCKQWGSATESMVS